jgi:hypothetical protein
MDGFQEKCGKTPLLFLRSTVARKVASRHSQSKLSTEERRKATNTQQTGIQGRGPLQEEEKKRKEDQ